MNHHAPAPQQTVANAIEQRLRGHHGNDPRSREAIPTGSTSSHSAAARNTNTRGSGNPDSKARHSRKGAPKAMSATPTTAPTAMPMMAPTARPPSPPAGNHRNATHVAREIATTKTRVPLHGTAINRTFGLDRGLRRRRTRARLCFKRKPNVASQKDRTCDQAETFEMRWRSRSQNAAG